MYGEIQAGITAAIFHLERALKAEPAELDHTLYEAERAIAGARAPLQFGQHAPACVVAPAVVVDRYTREG